MTDRTHVCFCPRCGCMGEYPVHGDPEAGEFITCTKCGEESTRPAEEMAAPEPMEFVD